MNIAQGTRQGIERRLTQRITFPVNDFAASLKMGRNFDDSSPAANRKI